MTDFSTYGKSPHGQLRILPRLLMAEQSTAISGRLVTTIDDIVQVVDRTTTVRDAIDILRNAHPHLTLFDVAIPNGVDLPHKIREFDKVSEIVIAMGSGSGKLQ